MEEGNQWPAEDQKHHSWGVMSPEIVEVGEDSKSIISSRDGGFTDVYIAVGKDDMDVVKWAVDHAVSPGARIFLVHVFPPITSIPTPVGRLSRSQLSQEQVQFYIREENNRRRNLLQKYICLCNDAKVTVDTMLVESNSTAKAILELIPVLNITNLVMGTKRPPSSRRLMKGKGIGKGEFVQKNAPEFCEVTIVCDGKKLVEKLENGEQLVPSASPRHRRPDSTARPQSERNFFDCICFSAKSD
ncbi:U-box domain-containing protein 52-like [Diospyros lotus]|uniref:U-box domain-containing protein 52-like n=1 Tax=Diospyros lotus TaxID=55363 RepID=UPI002250685E|nr:U-box domain-containing protein 52-like [Diospyros lotus]